VIAGLRQAYFKSLGTAAALMNDAFFPLPEWFVIHSLEDANDYIAIIEEAIGPKGAAGCLGSLEEKNSDDGSILQQFRQWLLTGDLEDLLDFHHQFAVHVMQRLGRKEWVRPFSTSNLEKLVAKTYETRYRVREIIGDEGFQSVARAVRNCTIYAAGLKRRDVHFGLAQKWKQKIKAGEDALVAEIAEFVQTQNWEVVNKLKGQGHVVRTEHLDSLLTLVSNRGAELVGSLLLAYGYSRAPKVEAESEPDLPADEGEK
jgi:hypothetical protein